MGVTLTNDTALQYAIESSPLVLPGSPTWFGVEPNTIGAFGSQLTRVPRNPISNLRQNRKGTVVDSDSPTEFEGDTTMSSFLDFIEGFVYSVKTNDDLRFRGRDVSASGYTIPSATAAQAAKLQFVSGGPASLVYAQAYSNAANNGLKELTADVVATDTVIQFSGPVVETSANNTELSIAGIRAEAGDLALAVSSNIGTLSSGNNGSVNPIDFTTLGLAVGQRLRVGGELDANKFGSTAAADGTRSFGGARIRAIAAGSLTLDKLDSTLVASDGTDDGNSGVNVRVDLLFTHFVRNVQRTSSEFLTRTYQFEAAFPNLYETDPPTPVANPNGYWYSRGNQANQLQLNYPVANKATANFNFVGRDVEAFVDDSGRKTNASTGLLPVRTEAFNTSSDFFRLGIFDVDENGLTTDFTDMTATLDNAASGERVIGFLGAKYVNNGNFVASMDATAVFTSADVINAVLANATVTADWTKRNGDGAISVDIPSGELNSEGLVLERDVTAKVQLSLTSFVDPFFETSIGVSTFAFHPDDQ